MNEWKFMFLFSVDIYGVALNPFVHIDCNIRR